MYLPPHVIAQQREEYHAAILRNVTVEDPRAREFTDKLQSISPDMFMVKAHNTIFDAVPLRPGFYHILVRNQDAPMSVITITDGGDYAEPDSRIFTQLGLMNMRESRVQHRLLERDREEQKAVEKENEDSKQRRLEIAREVVNSATRAQVSMDRTIPWTQNSQGRRER
jgi:hypothetical protein